jgi:hypothetical protein
MSSIKSAIIYQIYYINDPKINYIGSSMNNQVKYRWTYHKSDYKKYLENPNNNRANIYPYFKEYGIENFKILKLKDINVIDREHLKAYEQLYINKYKSVNKLNPFNILVNEDRKKYLKKYREDNKEIRTEYAKQRYKKNPEYFSNYAKEHKDKIKSYKQEYYLKQKEEKSEQYQRLLQRANKLIKCEICNIEFKQKYLKKHLNTQKHKNKESGNIIDYSNDDTKKLCEICNCYINKRHFNEHINTKKHKDNLNKL